MIAKKIVGLMACDPNGVIGNKGQLPWSYPEEMKHFRDTTYQQTIIMGYKTYCTMPKTAFVDQFGIIFSRKDHHLEIKNSAESSAKDSVIFVSSLQEFLHLQKAPKNTTWFMIGGGEIARLFLQAGLIQEFLLTKIHKTYQGDAFFPLELIKDWSKTLLRETPDFSIYRYLRNQMK